VCVLDARSLEGFEAVALVNAADLGEHFIETAELSSLDVAKTLRDTCLRARGCIALGHEGERGPVAKEKLPRHPRGATGEPALYRIGPWRESRVPGRRFAVQNGVPTLVNGAS